MAQRRIRAVYMRGGTSRCLAFHERDLPAAADDLSVDSPYLPFKATPSGAANCP